jgi:hypothetical protein
VPLLAGLDVSTIIWLVLIAGGIIVSAIQQSRQRRAQEQGKPPPKKPKEEPRLPFEAVVDEVFGPYMDRRRKAHAAKRAKPVPLVEIVDAPPPPKPKPEIRIIEEVAPPEAPSHEGAEEGPEPIEVEVLHAPPVVTVRPRLSLEDRLFSNPRFSPAAKMVVAREILEPPRFLRRGR